MSANAPSVSSRSQSSRVSAYVAPAAPAGGLVPKVWDDLVLAGSAASYTMGVGGVAPDDQPRPSSTAEPVESDIVDPETGAVTGVSVLHNFVVTSYTIGPDGERVLVKKDPVFPIGYSNTFVLSPLGAGAEGVRKTDGIRHTICNPMRGSGPRPVAKERSSLADVIGLFTAASEGKLTGEDNGFWRQVPLSSMVSTLLPDGTSSAHETHPVLLANGMRLDVVWKKKYKFMKGSALYERSAYSTDEVANRQYANICTLANKEFWSMCSGMPIAGIVPPKKMGKVVLRSGMEIPLPLTGPNDVKVDDIVMIELDMYLGDLKADDGDAEGRMSLIGWSYRPDPALPARFVDLAEIITAANGPYRTAIGDDAPLSLSLMLYGQFFSKAESFSYNPAGGTTASGKPKANVSVKRWALTSATVYEHEFKQSYTGATIVGTVGAAQVASIAYDDEF